MTATFGRLENETLALQPGLNVRCMTNEAGKSTWAAFILAMLYGVDTAERARPGVLPVKTKYLPWSGAPMAGRMEVEHEGRRIVLTRTSAGRVPMGQFSAVFADSGEPVPGMTGQTCGQMLIGASRSVFERSAFVRQLGLGVTQDDALESRLSALVTTGEETVSFSSAQRRLRDGINRCRHNKTGLLPDAERELEQVQGALRQIHEAHRADLALHEQMQQLAAERTQLEQAQRALQAMEENRRYAQREQARRALMQAQNDRRAAQARTSRLPHEQTLLQLEQDALDLQREQLPQEPVLQAVRPVCPAAFAGVAEDRLLQTAQEDMQACSRLTAGRMYPAVLAAAMAGVLLGAAGVLAVLRWFLPAACAGAASAVCTALALLAARANRVRRAKLAQAQAICARYDGRPPEQFVPLAASCREALQAYEREVREYRGQKAEYERRLRSREQRRARMLGSVRMLTHRAETLEDVLLAVRRAREEYEKLRRAGQNEQAAQERYEAVCAAVGDVRPQPVPEGRYEGMTLAGTMQAIRDNDSRMDAVRSRLDLSRGRVEALGDEAALHAREEALLQRIDMLTERRDALELASRTLAQANETLSARFSPELMRSSGEILSELTDGRYDRVQLDRQMNMQAGSGGSAAMHQLLALSCGTADQLYLSVRLAICRLLLGPDTPIILDDALAMFDDARMRLALRVLRREAQTRQILLLSCHGREAEALAGM